MVRPMSCPRLRSTWTDWALDRPSRSRTSAVDSDPVAELGERLLPADVVHLLGGDVGELAAVGGGRLEDRLEHRREGRLAERPAPGLGWRGCRRRFGMPAAYPPSPVD